MSDARKKAEEIVEATHQKHLDWATGYDQASFRSDLADAITAALTAERQEAEKWKSLVLDYCEEDGRIKALVRPILTPLEVDGDSYGVPGSLDIVETLLKRLKDAEKQVPGRF